MVNYIIVFFLLFINNATAIEEQPDKTIDNIETEKKGLFDDMSNFFTTKYNAFEENAGEILQKPAVVAVTNTLHFIFLSKNPIFQDKNHMVTLTYMHSAKKEDNLSAIFGAYSIPTTLFMNGRTSLEIGGLIGNIPYGNPSTGVISNVNVTQAIGGAMHEFVLNFDYFYLTAGIGFYIRGTDGVVTEGDRIGSRFTFGEKFAIGKSFLDRYNIEFMYRHFSNGDLTVINAGYDFLGFSLGVKF